MAERQPGNRRCFQTEEGRQSKGLFSSLYVGRNNVQHTASQVQIVSVSGVSNVQENLKMRFTNAPVAPVLSVIAEQSLPGSMRKGQFACAVFNSVPD